MTKQVLIENQIENKYMEINEVTEVVIDEVGGYKFIVAEIHNENGDKRLVVRANKGCDYHRVILALLRTDISDFGLSAKCIGGGQINRNSESKIITICGSSGDFGVEPDRSETVRMLERAFPDYQIISA